MLLTLLFLFFFYCSCHHRDLHSFPTRRSSDLRIVTDSLADLLLTPSRDADETLRREGKSSDRKSTRLNSSHVAISYAVFCLKKKKIINDSAESPLGVALRDPNHAYCQDIHADP